MKIAYIITRSDAIGGAHVHVRDLALSHLARGHQVDVLTGGEGPFTHELAACCVPYRSLHHLVRPVHPCHDLWAVAELRQHLRAIRPDLVSTHSSKAGWIGRLAAKSLGLPVVFTAHGWAFTEGVPERERRLYACAERLVAPLADRIITVSDHDRELALAHRVAAPERLVTIHNGVPDVPSSLFARPSEGPPRLAMVARFEPQKDHFTLLDALAGLIDVSWELELIGDGPWRKAVEKRVEDLSLVRRVRFLGARKDVAQLLARAQVVVLSSKWEGLPRTILEAMRAGLPVVASDVGGVREAVADGETGFLVPRGDVAVLRDRLLRLIQSPQLRVRMGQAGRSRYERHFTFERMFDETMSVYEAVLAAHHGTRETQRLTVP